MTTRDDDPALPDDATAVHSNPSKTSPSAPAGTQAIEIPGYRMTRRLGEGGMGAVFLAEELALGRQVAIKVVSDKIARDSEIRARFLREARLLATVEHPNVVRVYTFGEIDERAYLVMEYVEGETLADRIRRTGPMAPDAALAAVRAVADALSTAWEEKVIHRDIKPSNILFDKRGRLRVADFGLAKGIESATDSSLTQTGYLLGSPHYVAPEQAAGHEADFRSDIYSLGIVLFELITGRKPYDGQSAVAIVAKHLHEPLPNVRELVPDLPDEIADLITWMTAKDPAHRPQSYAELLSVLREDSLTPTAPLAMHDITHMTPAGPKAPLAAIAVGIIFVLALVFFVQRRASRSHAPAVENDGRIAVAIAPFYGPDAESLKEGRYMASMIEKAVATKLGDDVRVIGAEKVGEPIRDHDAARAIGERLGATAVIWGEAYTLARETQIQPSVTMIPLKKQVGALASPQSGGDPYVAMQPAPAVRLGSDATNQVEMRKMSADGIGDLITFVVASHAMREQNDPRKALELLSQMRVTADSQYHKALARFGMGEHEAARRDVEAALTLEPQHAQALALHADLDIRAARWSDAVRYLAAAKATARPFTSTEGAAFDGKVYFKEWFTNVNGRPTETANLLAADLATGRIVERHRLGGTPRTFEATDDALVIRYDIGRMDRPILETVRFKGGAFDPPLQHPAHLLVRLNSIRPFWIPASNFLWATGVRSAKTPKPTFSLDPLETERSPKMPMTLQDVRAAYETMLARDATHPAPYVYYGLALWELGDRAGAERAWTTAFGDGFPGTPYYDYSWLARHLEPYGHPRWADRAYEQARKRRVAARDPISTSLQIERLINTPFIRSAGFASRYGGDPLRQHQWFERTRAITGIALDGEELAAGAWARWFRSKGNEAAAKREDAVARRAVGVSAYFDWIGLADLGYSALLAFALAALVTLIVSIVRAARRVRPRSVRNVLARITRGERAAVVACLAMVLLADLAHIAVFRKISLYGRMPLGLSDALGAPLTAMSLDEILRTNPSPELRYAAAVSHHLAGHGGRATDLYRTLAGRDGVQENLDALRQRRPPQKIPTADAIVRAITRMRAGMIVRDAFAVFGEADEHTPIDDRIRAGSKIFLGTAIVLLAVIAIFASVPPVETRSLAAVRWSIAAGLLMFAILAWTMHSGATTSAEGRAVPGYLTQEAMPELSNVFPLPPMPDVDATEREAWKRSTPMRTFRFAVFGALLVGLVLVVRVPKLRRATRRPESAAG
jgi:tRNA A-37 threonylcarbamoyl transferase component Bud32/tetratricopeptide (TPR) repeat protein